MTTQKQKTFAIVGKSAQALKALTFVAVGCVGWSALAEGDRAPQVANKPYSEKTSISALSRGDKLIFTNRANPGEPETVENRALRFSKGAKDDLFSSLMFIKFFDRRKYDFASYRQLPDYRKIHTVHENGAMSVKCPSREEFSNKIFNTLETKNLEIIMTHAPTIEDTLDDKGVASGQSKITFHFNPIPLRIDNKIYTITKISCNFLKSRPIVMSQYTVQDLNAIFGDHVSIVPGNDSLKSTATESSIRAQQSGGSKAPSHKSKTALDN